ncbi:C40 family peptidase [Mucilaginibacter arboris]|uniref:Glycoside hydrolase n=1 Tax=Mucilaginibacter arboris TaxID=2682090 RepID=A0A7K1T008_9SPHI|nr:C40 family peptidase [Mucilaginibacter arboris]MVN22904.1 glycoside hydrolase [Mucilaginibacter arboris]
MRLKKLNRIAVAMLLLPILFSSCKSRKYALKGHPGQIVQPAASISNKYSELMGVEESNITNGRLYTFIDNWMGTPYRFGGLDKDGIDCSGFTFLLEQQVYGINLPRMTGQQVTVIKRKYEEQLQEGDLVFFDFDGKKFSHVGVYLQNDYVVHASTKKGIILVKLHDPAMYKYFSRCGSVITE